MIEALKENAELWGLFTRREEYGPPGLDKHGRFPYSRSRDREVMAPRVSGFLLDHGLQVDYGDGKRFAVCLTHDIDAIYPTRREMLNGSIRSLMKGDMKSGFTLPMALLNKSWNPLWNFKETMAVEEKYGAQSTFFFMATRRDPDDKVYRIDDLKGEMGNILDRGWDIGLHGGYYAYDSLGSILDEKRSLERALGKKVTGYRNHFLRFKVPDTWRLLEKAGFEYDSTLGYADHIGFRNSMCHPFRPYDLTEGRWLGVTEIPLVVMADTLFNYMMLDYGRSWDAIRTLVDAVEKNRGVMTILWHNYQMGGKCLKLYEKILGYCREKGALMTSAADIHRLAPKKLMAPD